MIGDKILELRKKHNLTQEAFSEYIKVSRQAVQKWEKNMSLPDSDKLILISKIFNVSIDYILDIESSDPNQEFRVKKEIQPSYQALHWWEVYSSQLRIEYQQCIDEGKDVSKLKDLFESIHSLETSADKEQLADILHSILQNSSNALDYQYNEPDDINMIYALTKHDYEYPFHKLSSHALINKIKGAWMGRICGCLLGKTVEGIRTDELIPLLKETGNYPMHRYILKSDMNEEIYAKYKFNLRNRCYADAINYAPADDDTNYTVLSSVILDKYSDEFSSYDVAKTWLEKQPKSAYCTAERVAYLNIVKGYLPPETGIYKNPFREWIGAQIRVDYYGYINPGDPKKAAYMAWKDARVSHVKNGIYSSMLIAAIISAAACCNDVKEAIKFGLYQIPQTSRLYEAVMKIIKQFDSNVPSDKCFESIHNDYDENLGHHWCHAISNTCIVIASLLYGNNDYSKTICLAVQAGFDTDCNGATAGSIIGIQKGIEYIPLCWTSPIKNKLDTSIFGIGTIDIDYLTDKTHSHISSYSSMYKAPKAE
ncbi:MAG: ADP-ribosylglycohydrolase family protein [Clostridia bacterium]|jgi:transcriptional regulator with XRE-family HTH domain/ADP-ribosylglycohydrolase